jgi:hypothetical protein
MIIQQLLNLNVYHKCLISVVIKYYIVHVFIVEFNLCIKLKNHSFPAVCLYGLFSLLLRVRF